MSSGRSRSASAQAARRVDLAHAGCRRIHAMTIERSAMVHALGSRLLRAAVLLLLLGSVAACHTMEGLGQDLSALGGKLRSKAQEHDH